MSASRAQRRRAQQLATDQLRAEGMAHPEVAGALLVTRGLHGRPPDQLATLLGVSPEHLRSLESGRRPPEHAPRRVRDLDPDLDWDAAGVTPPGHPDDPATRHPAAWRPPG